jgi:FkbM family methyltransferase
MVDAGAFTGDDTVEFAERWPAGQIHAFEPVPDIYRQLQHAVREFPNVATYPVALGGRDGRAVLNVSSGQSIASSSLRSPKEHLNVHPQVTFETQVEVEVMTLDTWRTQHGIGRVDCLWLDMQGAELELLKASPDTLGDVQVIVTEAFTVELYDGAPLWEETRTWLKGHDFRVEYEDFAWSDSGNVLLVREGLTASSGAV